MHPCGYIVGEMCCTTLGSVVSPSNLQIIESFTGVVIGDPTEDTWTETEEMPTGITRGDRTTGAVQDAVLEEAVTLVGGDRTGPTVEVEVRKGVVVATPPPSPLPQIQKDNAGRQSELSGQR